MSTYDAARPATGRSTHHDSNLKAHVAWGGGGFLLGVIVWHFVGFWSFISTVVFRGPDPTAAATATAPLVAARTVSAAGKRGQTVLGAAPAQASGGAAAVQCSVLALDRSAGTTTLATCEADARPFRVVESSPRGDRQAQRHHRDGDRNVMVDADAAIDTSIDARLDARLGQRAVQFD